MNNFVIYFFSFFLSIVLTGMVRYYAFSRNLMDIPNARSSHDRPTPRGGGLAFVLLFLSGILILKSYFGLVDKQVIAFFFPCLLVSIIGFMDDRKSLPALVRLISHLTASSFAIVCLGTIPSLFFGPIQVPAFILFIFTLLFLSWMLNLFNFMDGIDGLAALEAVFALLGMALIYNWNGQTMAACLPLYLAFTVGGFIYWNFPPAKIFMGDVGSGFLGLSLGLLALIGGQMKLCYFFAWLIILGLFIVDATYTLLERIIKKEAIWKAHCSHAYQIAALYYGQHRFVTIFSFVINLLWLFPLAFLVGTNQLNSWLGLFIAYCPIILIGAKIKNSAVAHEKEK